ncbi:MAG: 4'-phosphopantetheinyl transferase superfamily protein [Tannerella sp.]|jgi:phosphopantetheinyl transferase|nr:4'-phosphopantetheinyl transferase superfamily protein [Tannerella sp.]
MPLLHKYESPRMGIWKITESWEELLESLVNKDVYYSGMMEISSGNRRREWLAVRLLLQHLSGHEARIGYRGNGSPFLPGSACNISISHTKGFAAILLSENKNPGIDMEYRSERAWKLRGKYMNENEWNRMMSLPDNGNVATAIATVCWCAKETAFKILGETGVDFSEHLCVEPFGFSEEGFLLLEEKYTERHQRFRINYRVTGEYILTWKE